MAGRSSIFDNANKSEKRKVTVTSTKIDNSQVAPQRSFSTAPVTPVQKPSFSTLSTVNTPKSSTVSTPKVESNYETWMRSSKERMRDTAKQLTELENRRKKLKDDYLQTQARFVESSNPEDLKQLRAIESEMDSVKVQLEDLEKLRPTYNARNAEKMYGDYEAEEKKVKEKHGSVEKLVADLDSRAAKLSEQEQRLKELEAQLKVNPSEHTYQTYLRTYDTYTRSVAEYQKLYADYEPVQRAWQDYDAYDKASKSDVGFGEGVKRVVNAGITQTGSLLASTLALPDKLLSKAMPGVATPLADFAAWMKEGADRDAALVQEAVHGKKGWGQAANVGVATVAAIPQMLAALLSSGTSMAAPGTTLATGAGAPVSMTTSLMNAAKQALKNPSYIASMASTLGSDFDEAKAAGATDIEALATAVIASSVNAGIEIGGGLETVDDSLPLVQRILKSGREEGWEEVLQGIVSGTVNKGIYDFDKSIASLTDPDAILNPQRMAEEAFTGAAVGMLLTGTTSGLAAAANKLTGPRVTHTRADHNPVSPAAAPEVQQLTQQAEAVQAANPEATVLDAATTMYFDIAENKGKNTMKKARLKAEVVKRLVEGKKVEDGEINALNLTDQNYREVFTKLTGVQFPDGKLQIEQLRSLARSAHTVAQQAKQVQAAPAAPVAPITQTSVAERVAQAQQTVAQAAPETDNAVTFEAFVEHAKQYPEYANAGAEVLEVAYAQFLQDSGMSVEMNGKPLSFAEFVGVLRSAPDGDKLTVGELGRRFQQLAQRQNMNKEANYGGQNLLHSEGLSGQPDQRSGGQSRSVPETAGRAEGDGGTRRGDQSGSQAGRSGEVRSAGQNQKGTGSYRTVKVNGNPMTEVRPEAYTPEMQGLVDQYAAIGVNAHIVIEGYPIDASGHYADGVTIFNTDGTTDVFLQVVGAHAMAERSDHEKAHVVLGRDPVAKEQAIAALGNAMSEKELLDLVNAYLPMYGSAYANSEDLVGDLLEEIICDAYANLNRANAGAPKYHDAVSGVIEAQLQSYSASYWQDVTLTDDAGNLVVESDGNGHSTFSMSTYQDSGRDILTQWMGKAVVNGDLTQQDADDIVNTLDLIYDICEEARGDYAPFDAWSEAKVVVNEQGNPVFSVVKANGDYAMNLDFSLVCKKRRTLDAVLNELVKQGFVDNLALNEKQIVKINDLIRSYGFEVACDLCFVDAKRYRQGKVADDFVKLYNDLVQSMIPKGSGLKPAYFNFGQSTMVDNAGLGIHELSDDQLDFTKIEKVLKEKGEKSVEYKTAMLLKTSPADRKLTMRGDFLSTRGFDELNLKNPRVLKLFNSKKGSGGPKSAVSDVQYLNEVLTSKTFTPEKAYAVGGVRIQSFSDYVPRMVFDYVQMIADLAAKKLPAHAYTKEELFVMQFGLTGMKINMSLIPKVVDGGIAPGLDADGNYAWADESFNFDKAKKIQKAKGYSRNCGTIAVGVSDAHIRKLMADPEIRMVIPYHKSGLNPVVAKMNKIEAFVNYTDFQNTRRPNGKNGKKLDKDVAADKKLLSEMPDFNTKMRELGDPRAAAEFYVRWCEENNLLPKFDQFAYKTIDGMPVEKDGKKVVDENYYKLLEDFTVYDKGQYVEQTGLTMTFPTKDSAFGDMKSLIKRGLSEDALLEAKRDEDVPKIVADIKQMKFSASDAEFKMPVGMQSDIYYPKTRREQHVFDRELANKTSDLKTGDTRGIIITTADNLYFVTARGYMRGEIDEKIELTDANIEDLRKRVGFREKPDGLTENFTAYLSAYWDARRRLGGSVADSDQARSGARDVGLADGKSTVDAAGRSGSPESDVTDPESLIPGSMVFDGENAYTVPQQASEESGAFNLDDYDIEDLLKLSDAEFEKLYAQLGLNTTINDDILLEDDFDFEDIAEELNEEPEKIEILFRRKGLGDDYVAPEKQAVMTEKRIDERIVEHGAGHNAGYARRYITRISPKDFIDLTVHERNTDRETFDTRVTGDVGSTMKDWDYGAQLTESREPPVLDINLDTGQVIGHNGRHRVRALEMAGIESVEIEVELYQDGYLKKLGAKTLPDLAISSQFDTKIETHLSNLIPLNKAHRDEIMQSYGEKAHTKAKVKYSVIDSSGRLLTEDQQEYFKNAKSRDNMGRLMTMYHGTESFGFTVFDPEFSDDGISLFFTNNPKVARSYSGTDENDIHALSKDTDMRLYQQDRVIHSLKKAFDVLENVGIKKFAPNPVSDDVVTDRVKLWTEETLEEAPNWLAALREHDTEDRRISGLLDAMTDIEDLLRDLRVFRDSGNQLRQAQTMLSISREFKWLRNHIQHYTDWGLIDEELGEGLVTMLEDSAHQIPSLKNLVAVLENGDDDVYAMFDPELGFTYMTDKMIVEKAQEMQRRNREGLYEVYVNVENPLVVDANYREWNDLVWDARFDRDSPEWDGDTTREIAAWAKEHDYDGVIFRNLVDIGAYDDGDTGASDIVIAFKSEQVKSTANKNPTKDPDIRYSVTPAFEKWYQETYNEELTSSQLKRRLQTAERRAEQAEHDRKAAELKNTFDKEMNLTAWMMHHTKKMREQKRTMNEKLAEARKEKTEAVRAAVAETKEIERAKAAVQHDADRMAERRNAAKRLRIREDAYKQKVTEMKENQKLKRNAARAVLRDSKLAAKRRAEIEAEQGLVDTIRKNPKQRSGVEKLQDAAQALRTLGRSAYRNFVNMAEAIDRFSKRQAEGMRAGTLVNILGGTASTVESMFKKGLVDRAGNRIGESMSDVFLCWDEAHKNVNEELQAVLQDFMLHRHNIDRMSIVARAESALETFENTHEWLRDMDSKEFARLVAMTEKEAEKSGKQEAQLQAFQYARLIREYTEAQNKPIFKDDKGNPVTAETSQKMVDKYIAENPWLLEKANGIYEWWDKFMREWAVGDTISEAEYSRMRQMYPHYVPTYRTTHNGVGGAGFVGNGAASVSKAVKKAKGSTEEVMNIEDSFSNLVSKIVRLNRLNEMYMNIVDTAMLDEDGLFSDMAYFDWDWQAGQYGNALVTGSADIVDLTDTVEETEKAGLEKVGPDEFKLTAWRNGRKYTAYISKDLYQSIGNVTGHLANDLEEGLLKIGNTLTGPMKTAITGINPTFAVRNLSRDLPTAIINSISGLAFPKYYAQAAKEIAQNSEHWQQFQALGGTNATYYNDSQGWAKAMAKGKNLGSKAVGAMGAFNEVTESQTRFAEYLATVDKLGDTYENRLQGIKNAAEVTVDFSRKGRYGKVINAWVPYWNPAVQGIDKTVRSLIESPDGSAIWKQASKTLGRAAMTTILLEAVLQAVLHGLDRDDEWEELNDRTKDTYYCIPLKDSKTFLKIPKNREWGAILGTPFMRMLEYANGREDPFENYIETSIEPNFLPPAIFRPDAGGGFTSDIIGVSQALDLAKNEDFAGRTIVPYSYQQGTLSQQYDSETSWFAKQLGSLLNWSPMQIDYILGDYFGDFGRMFIQATSKATLTGEQNLGKAALDIVTNPFVADARYSSYAVNKYYDLMDDLDRVVQDRKNQLGTDGAKETLEYQTQKAVDTLYGKAITELNREVREMADGPEKDAAKEQIAQLAEDAVEFYNDSISGKIPQPELTANYANYSQIVSDELIQMNELTKEYNFKPRTSAPESYVDPRNKKNEFVLTEEQQDYYMELYIETYNEEFERMIQSGRYKNAKPERKAEMLEDVKQDVADTAKKELIDWLRKNGIRSTPKK